MRIRRDKLLRLAKQGKLLAIGGYSYIRDEPEPGEHWKGEMPVYVMETGTDGKRIRKEGFYNILESDFKSTCGGSWINPNGTVTLYVHSNCNHDFKILA